MPAPRLSLLKFKAGAAQGRPPLEFKPGAITVLVGPNNSGKSLALREIETWCRGANSPRKVMDSLSAEFPTDPVEALAFLETFRAPPPPGNILQTDYLWVAYHQVGAEGSHQHYQVHVPNLRSYVSNRNEQALRETLLRPCTMRLDGRTRFALADPKPAGDLQLPPQNHLWALFQDDQARARVRELTKEAFSLHFVVDPTGMGQFRIRMSRRAPASLAEEQSLDASARQFHAQAPLISELSDGVQAFTGLVSAVMSLKQRVLLIDEPEAFLHPILGRRLGRNLATIVKSRQASLIVATHSAEFLMGAVEANPDTSVVRLTWDGSTATARMLAPDDVRKMMQRPLLRSTNSLNAIFHRAVVVCEADADRALYNEVNRRLTDEGRGRHRRGFSQCTELADNSTGRGTSARDRHPGGRHHGCGRHS